MKTLVILPTYNESENIENIIEALLENEIKPDILVVDDNSPDDTGEIVKRIADITNRVKLLSREGKLGLGSAYIEGFKYALKHNYDYIFEMDADFSHNPQTLNDFIRAIEEVDFVIGSRYINKGQIIGWNFWRYFISFGGNLLARLLLKSRIKDMTSGFRCYRRKVLEALDFDEILSEGYFFQVEILYRILLLGFKGREIPIVFKDREMGESKISVMILFEALRNLRRIRHLKKP
ncbi:MAG: polyprenol monophosphomannose synthase [Candidatus Jordarchaeum sp.]|uniref:polyprenol monophosphomannose synthase n=1 Tax=Candidatus Jordarchaeum sp. TaxID=2823881 RepID=UPI00404B6BC9